MIERCAGPSDGRIDQVFDIDHGSVRAVLAHMIGNLEVWTDLMEGRPVRPKPSAYPSISNLVERHAAASDAFGTLAWRINATGRLDEQWLDTLDNPPTSKTYASAILHVITHNMHHRAHLL